MLTEDDAEKAVRYLASSAESYAQARANLIRKEHMLKVSKALAMKASGENSIAAQEREALTSEKYSQALNDVWEASVEAEKIKALREAAVMLIETWRSMNAANRQVERAAR